MKGNVITAYSDMFMASGDTLRFKDEHFLDTDAESVVVDFEVSDKIFTITLDRDVSASVRPGFSSWDTRYDSGNYVIENNCFHEHRARALLLQSSEGLCRNNRFYKTQGQAIKIVMDIAPGYWLEGKGVNGLEVSGNTFDSCDFSSWGSQIEIGTSLNGKEAEGDIFRNIEIKKNRFIDSQTPVIKSSNVDGLIFKGNKVKE